MGLPLLIAGLVLVLAGSDWFGGAHTVGIILTVFGAVLLFLQFVVWGAVVALISRS